MIEQVGKSWSGFQSLKFLENGIMGAQNHWG